MTEPKQIREDPHEYIARIWRLKMQWRFDEIANRNHKKPSQNSLAERQLSLYPNAD